MRESLLVHARVARGAATSAIADLRAIHTWRTYLFGWIVRVVAQVAFFGLIGVLLGDQERVVFLVVGNAVMIAALEVCMTTASTQWERWQGTLPLLISAPTAFPTVFVGRSVQWIISGVPSATISLLAASAIFGVDLPWPAALWVLPLIFVVAVSTYAVGVFLGALVLRWPELRNVVANVAAFTMMAIGGVMVPVSFWPGWVQAIAQALPITHALGAVRGVLAGDPASAAVGGAAAAVAVGLCWLAAAVGVLAHLSEQGRRDGTIEFG